MVDLFFARRLRDAARAAVRREAEDLQPLVGRDVDERRIGRRDQHAAWIVRGADDLLRRRGGAGMRRVLEKEAVRAETVQREAARVAVADVAAAARSRCRAGLRRRDTRP